MKEKSYKREVAAALLIWLVYLVEIKDTAIVELLVWPIISFASAAFLGHEYSQLQQRLKSPRVSPVGNQRSGQHPDWEDK